MKKISKKYNSNDFDIWDVREFDTSDIQEFSMDDILKFDDGDFESIPHSDDKA